MDLKNIDLKNLNMADIKEKLAGVDKKTYIKFGIGFFAIILFLIIYYAVLNPIVDQKKAQYEDKILKENEILTFNNEIVSMKAKIKKITPDYKNSSGLFHSKAEVEDLYLSLSRFAAVNGLVISKIEKKEPKPVLKSGKVKQANLNLKDVSYMDSSGISVLIESHQKALEKNTKVVVKEVSKSVLKVIMMAKLEQILNLE